MHIYLFYLSLFLAAVIAVVYIIKRNPDLSFWFLINILFDPGGYVAYYLESNLFLSLNITDVAIVPIIFCLYVINANFKIIYKDQFLYNFLKVFFIFAVYYFIVFGAVVPYLHNDLDYITFLQKNRNFVYYVIILISVYFFTLRGLKYFYLTTLFIGFSVLSAFLVSLVTGLDIIPITSLERYEDSEMMRVYLYSWGLFFILFPLSFILFSFSRKIKLNIKFKKLAYLAGMLMVVALLVSLTRRYYITIPGTLLIIILVSSYIFRKSKAIALGKILVPLGAVLIILNLTLPQYIDYIVDISQDTFQLLTTGSDTRGEKEYRVSGKGDLEITKKYIEDNFFLGTGYNYLNWGDEKAESSRGPLYASAMDAAQEVPIYYIFFGYGFVGFIIMVFLYSFLIRMYLKLFSLIKRRVTLLNEYPYEVMFTIYILYMILDKFTFSLYGLGNDFTTLSSGIFIGIGFALLKKLKRIISNIEQQLSYDEDKLKELNEVSFNQN
jgi:hypothetical protein